MLVTPESLPADHSTGARPAGVSSPTAAAANIQQMFDTIAPTYDRANHLLSFGLDRLWWLRAARTLRPILARPEAVVLDLCCGTGDMTLALYQHRPQPPSANEEHGKEIVILSEALSEPSESKGAVAGPAAARSPAPSPAPLLALDFSHNMLSLALPKFAGKNIVAIEADALHLPLPDASVDLVTFAFGFRNLAGYPEGLAELHRVLRPGGEIAILECNQPGGITGALYSLYFQRILPTLGGLISRNPAAYKYLPASVARFPRPPRMKELILAAGFTDSTWTSYTFGTAGLYRATKP
jgi:demethylmenaquinone methyltransferase/2-methoxy-6-polyprenyl-1,4-benzoquinol methylase